MARGGLFICDQVMLEQELKEVGRKSHSYLGKEHTRQREVHVQSPEAGVCCTGHQGY